VGRPVRKEVRIIKGIALVMLVAASLPGLAGAAEPGERAGPGVASRSVANAPTKTAPYQAHSDEQLTVLAAQWDSLDTHQRRALLTEMKSRMARGGKREPVLHIRTERRYGRIIRQPDGRVIRIETNVVRVQPVTPEMLARVRSHGGFGLGFEHRVGLHRRAEEPLGEGPAGAAVAGAPEGAAESARSAAAEEEEAGRSPLPVLKAAEVSP